MSRIARIRRLPRLSRARLRSRVQSLPLSLCQSFFRLRRCRATTNCARWKHFGRIFRRTKIALSLRLGHEQALREAERAVKTGKAQFSEWDEAKKRIRRKAAKL